MADEVLRLPGGKAPPNNLRAEQSVLGCAMSGERPLAEIMALLSSEDFYQPAHRLIYEAILELSSSFKPVDLLTVSDLLENKGTLAQVGGLSYISSLPEMAPVVANAAHYAELVRQKALLRRMLAAFQELIGLCLNDPEDANLLIDLAAKRIYEIRENRDISGFESVRQILSRTLDELYAFSRGERKQTFVRSGFQQLDRKLGGGLRPGSLYVLACRPGMGKSALALNMALHAAVNHGVHSAVFSLEMSKEEICNRLISSHSMVQARSLSSGEIRPEEMDRIKDTILPLSLSPIFIDDRAGTSVMEMMSKCRQLKLESKLGLVVIDYLQLMSGRTTESRQQEISEISRSLKIMAKELNVPVLALSQLSRSCELRDNKRPMLSDLRESGAIEQDADVVLFLYRDRYYKPEQPQTEHEEAEVIVAKNRQGEPGSVMLGWWPRYTLFFDPEQGPDSSASAAG